MSVRRTFLAALALAALTLGAGCGEREGDVVTAETDDPYFVQGRQLQKQGRNGEALNAFLKVIEKRGDRGSAEAHLEAGVIYLNQTKDPVEAYHHFRKYLELQPNSKQAPLVRGMVDTARREFAKTIPGRPLDDQSVRLQADEELSKLRRENDELRAELAVLRGGGAVPVNRTARMINVPLESRPSAPIIAATPANAKPEAPIVPAPAPLRGSMAGTAAATPPGMTPAPTAAQPRGGSSFAKTAPAPARPSTATRGTHTVAAKETLFSLSKRYGVRMEDLAAANGITINTPLKIGTVLKIPAASGR